MALAVVDALLRAPWPVLPALVLAATAISTVALGVYRLTLHPLAKFPGPKLAAFTGWYEFYADIFRGPGETFAFEIQRMHERYGPIVRITPHELHVSDHDFFDTLYAGGAARRDKYPPIAGVQGTPQGIFGTVGHDAHKKRRGAISWFFSKQSVLNHEDLIHEKVDLLCEMFRDAWRESREINIRIPLLAYTTDFYCAHALGDAGDMHLLRDLENAKTWRDSIIGLLHVTLLVKQFPWIIPYAVELPPWLIKYVSSDLALVVKVFWDIREQAKVAIKEYEASEKKKRVRSDLMQAILSSNLPPSEKTYKRMAQEGFNILSASGDTIARTITTAMYHLLSNPVHLDRLKQELWSVMPDPNVDVELNKLENLPWFTACIKESLRIAALIICRATLQAPNECLVYKDWVIPPNTPVGMSLADLMMDPNAFPEPKKFDPERWLESHPNYVRNCKYFVPFHRGHRNCIGMNLAWAEMYIALAKLFRRFDFELYDVVRERDIDNYRDCFLGEPRDDNKGVRVKVRGLLA